VADAVIEAVSKLSQNQPNWGLSMSNSSRRDFFMHSLGAAVILASGRALGASNCEKTASQTSGPFVPDDFPFSPKGDEAPYIEFADNNSDLTVVDDLDGKRTLPKGQIIYLRGEIVDQNCNPVSSATVYLWQADTNGHYNHTGDPNIHSAHELDPHFQYSGVSGTDRNGRFQFKTIKPQYYPLDPADPTVMRTAHLHIAVTHPRCRTLITQTYFEGNILEDIDRIRDLNKLDIILATNGKIPERYRSLVVEYKEERSYADGPVGDVRLSVHRQRS